MTPIEHTPEQDWFKSSRSANNAACVEVRLTGGVVAVRDSKDLGGPILAFSGPAWSGFVATLQADPS
ncbi:DUF397 domain-containing protein [Plantactinospora solaniradicis]|uniref:DUF397 domain-containing protein n=1 Tax=Plantactinospora solaniradicis TaxID=1723736 RepID=A0ABW1K6Y9_9ACTN